MRLITKLRVLAISIALLGTPALYADDQDLNNEPETQDNGAFKTSNPDQISRITNDFEQLLAEQEEPAAVVEGLRTGNEFTYNGEFLQFEGGMGYGNVVKALALAEHNGGNLQEVLAMRESGMGWGEIAQSLDTKVGTIVSGIKNPEASTTSSDPNTVGNSTVNASKAIKQGHTTTLNNGYRPSNVGITDGLGNSISSPGLKKGHNYSKANKTHNGAQNGGTPSAVHSGAAGSAGITSGLNNGMGQGKGNAMT